jgi:hypothetical protein
MYIYIYSDRYIKATTTSGGVSWLLWLVRFLQAIPPLT